MEDGFSQIQSQLCTQLYVHNSNQNKVNVFMITIATINILYTAIIFANMEQY